MIGKQIWGQLIILLMQEQQQRIVEAIQRSYQQRTPHDHALLAELLLSALPHSSQDQVRKLSFFLQQYREDIELVVGSVVIVRKQEGGFRSFIYHRQDIPQGLVLVVDRHAVVKCQQMGGSVEEEAKWLQKCDCFQQVPKKRLFLVIRQAEPISLTYGQCVPLNSGHSFFFARKGEFCYELANPTPNTRHAQVLAFKEGHLFTPHSYFKQQEEESTQKLRKYQVRCKSSKGLVYMFSREFFAMQMLRYCQEKLQHSGEQLTTLLQDRAKHVGSIRRANSQLLSQPIRRSASTQLQALVAAKVSGARKGSTWQQPERVLDIIEKTHDYRTLKDQKPPRNHIFSKSQLLQLATNPEENESDLLLWKKAKCLRLRQIARTPNPPLSKAQTMLGFIKATLQFQKSRRRPSLL